MNRREILRASIAATLATSAGGLMSTGVLGADPENPIAITKAGKVRGIVENGVHVFKLSLIHI